MLFFIDRFMMYVGLPSIFFLVYRTLQFFADAFRCHSRLRIPVDLFSFIYPLNNREGFEKRIDIRSKTVYIRKWYFDNPEFS